MYNKQILTTFIEAGMPDLHCFLRTVKLSSCLQTMFPDATIPIKTKKDFPYKFLPLKQAGQGIVPT